MRAVEKFITSAPPVVVWQILADVEHWPGWTPTVIEIKPLDDKGLRVGAQYRVVQPKLRPAIYEVRDCVPNQRFLWVQKLPGGALLADHRISLREGKTEVELSFTSKGLVANIVAGVFSRMIRDYVASEARSLKNRCDSMGQRTISEAGSVAS